MQVRRAHTSGFSLVELLVVMAIVAIMTAVAYPVFLRSGVLSRSDVDVVARKIYMTLSAARMYAAANNVETAVVYGVRKDDPVPGEKYIDSMVVARKFADGETGNLDSDEKYRQYDKYVFVEKGFETLPRDGYMAVSTDGNLDLTFGDGGFSEVAVYENIDDETPFGVGNFSLVNEDETDYEPVDEDKIAYFVAHVFKPSGELAARSSRTRIELEVGIITDRAKTDENGEVEEGVEPVTIEIFRPTGRTRIAP